ncbi:GDSL-type esterase/lipase family protein [Mangrovibacterium diazotrophicum]|uniref:Lysophospholipase L1-like esterase n=1 Tax=Mangrovibacterium diazotrophicum TaxID=1261403 RepID=A0A419W593_9BACT|nr:GDSL-type esterase/lipase family protein [Mangrovibacterium diazotrophicum]RKD90628.1 lysophospholipase L1-like esterase [Mangrovibacterium diazotrophicum]
MKKTLFLLLTIAFCSASFGQSIELSAEQRDNLYPSGEIVSRYHNDWTQRHYRDRIKVFKSEPLNFGDIVFIGNSITEKGRDWSEKFGTVEVRNRGIAGDLTDGVLKRMDEIVYFKPKAVFILIGINDLFNLHHDMDGGRFKYDKIVPSPEYVGKNIEKIAREIHRKSPDTRIFVRTVLPTNRPFLKDDILVVNEIIRTNEAKGNYKLIDLYAQFVDADGGLTNELTVDGVHLSEKGYEKWVAFEKPILEELVGN